MRLNIGPRERPRLALYALPAAVSVAVPAHVAERAPAIGFVSSHAMRASAAESCTVVSRILAGGTLVTLQITW
jgi:hypothetical protein